METFTAKQVSDLIGVAILVGFVGGAITMEVVNWFSEKVTKFLARKLESKYISHIDKAPVYYTRRGGSYVKPFDVIRSRQGRKIIKGMSDVDNPKRG